jgi:uncharacterized protein (DUF2267 family)
MQHEEFLGKVQQRARLSSRTQAERAARATLETLAERLAGGSAENLAAQLDPETARYLRGARQQDTFSLDEFFERVHARAVIAVLQEAVDEGAVRHVRQQLPHEFDPLFTSGSEGELRPLRR